MRVRLTGTKAECARLERLLTNVDGLIGFEVTNVKHSRSKHDPERWYFDLEGRFTVSLPDDAGPPSRAEQQVADVERMNQREPGGQP